MPLAFPHRAQGKAEVWEVLSLCKSPPPFLTLGQAQFRELIPSTAALLWSETDEKREARSQLVIEIEPQNPCIVIQASFFLHTVSLMELGVEEPLALPYQGLTVMVEWNRDAPQGGQHGR